MTDTSNLQVLAPSRFVPEHATAFARRDGTAVRVDADNPLPITPVTAAAGSTALAGATSVSGSFGPFAPDLGRTIWISLSGTWAGTAQVLRSIDGGTTKLPLTLGGQAWASFSAGAQEPIGEESVAGVTYWLAVALTSGTLAYRVQQ